MSIHIPKSWVAIGRRQEHGISLEEAYTEVFEALCEYPSRFPLGVADTIVFSRLGFQYYCYDWPQQKVMALQHVPSPNAALKYFMSLDEGSSIAAVWLTEVRDSKGYLICAEYLTMQDLLNFFQVGDVKKIGVLQRFICPRPFRHVDEVAQEVLVYYQPGRPIRVERRLGNHPLDSMTEHPTVRGNLWPPVPTVGKILARTTPFTAAECNYGNQGERITLDSFVALCDSACTAVVAALHNFRRVAAAMDGRNSPARSRAEVRPVASMVLQLRQNFHDGQLYFISVLSLRHPADRYHADVQYELVHIPQEGVKFIQTPLGPSELVITPLDPRSVGTNVPSAQKKEVAPAAAGGGGGDGEDEDEDTDDPNRYSMHRRPLDPELYSCPNCDQVLRRNEFVRMEYREILDHYLKQCGAEFEKAAVDTQHQHNAANGRHARPHSSSYARRGLLSTLDVYSQQPQPRHHPQHLPSRSPAASRRPESAASASHKQHFPEPAAAEPARTTIPTAFVVTAAPDSVKVPRVLSRLNTPVTALPTRPQLLLRSTPLCPSCATEFGATLPATRTVASERTEGKPEEEGASSTSPLPPRRGQSPSERRSLALKQRLAEAAPTCLSSDVIDQMVITPLQEQHRLLRQAERMKYSMKLQDIDATRRMQVESYSLKADRDELDELDRMVGSFGIRDTVRVPAAAAVGVVEPSQAMSLTQKSGGRAPPAAASHAATALDASSRSQPCDKSGAEVELEVVGTGPDVPLHLLLQNDLYYKMMHFLSTDPCDGVSMSWNSSLLKPMVRPAVVVPTEELESAADQHLLRIANAARRGRRTTWKALAQNSTTFADLSDAERLMAIRLIGGDPTRIVPDEDFL